ncbi:MAG: geranylgeranylglyceryl/heptaprenylglyceryl phosphate synthase [Theionarchaea archaeon DG-70-1]|nr:MAG: geranylgeranylglyceryl/heptaprenylglyceryl phosphate synthase [Theionarchaea archaeon DG-70-1]
MGRVFTYITEKLTKEKLHFALLDPEDCNPQTVPEIAAQIERAGSDAIMVGGSIAAVGSVNDVVIQAIKKGTSLPVIIFPGGSAAVSPYADAIFFMSILNSRNPYFITKAQALGAVPVKLCQLEPIPMGYLIVEPGEAVGWIGEADAIPRRKPKIAAAYALAAQYMGMDLVYLEAGSGALEPVPEEMVTTVKEMVDIPVVVGGGIRTPEQAFNIVKAGADIVVTGTIIEKAGDIEKALQPLVKAVKGES